MKVPLFPFVVIAIVWIVILYLGLTPLPFLNPNKNPENVHVAVVLGLGALTLSYWILSSR